MYAPVLQDRDRQVKATVPTAMAASASMSVLLVLSQENLGAKSWDAGYEDESDQDSRQRGRGPWM